MILKKKGGVKMTLANYIYFKYQNLDIYYYLSEHLSGYLLTHNIFKTKWNWYLYRIEEVLKLKTI